MLARLKYKPRGCGEQHGEQPLPVRDAGRGGARCIGFSLSGFTRFLADRLGHSIWSVIFWPLCGGPVGMPEEAGAK